MDIRFARFKERYDQMVEKHSPSTVKGKWLLFTIVGSLVVSLAIFLYRGSNFERSLPEIRVGIAMLVTLAAFSVAFHLQLPFQIGIKEALAEAITASASMSLRASYLKLVIDTIYDAKIMKPGHWSRGHSAGYFFGLKSIENDISPHLATLEGHYERAKAYGERDDAHKKALQSGIKQDIEKTAAAKLDFLSEKSAKDESTFIGHETGLLKNLPDVSNSVAHIEEYSFRWGLFWFVPCFWFVMLETKLIVETVSQLFR